LIFTWSTIPPISNTYHLKPLEKKAPTYGLVIQGPAFGQELEYGSVKPFYGIPTTLDNWISNDNASLKP
jgi:hypothetical protein